MQVVTALAVNSQIPSSLGQRGLAEVVAVGEGAEDGLVAVGAGADFGDLAVGDEEHLVGRGAELDEGVAGGVFVLAEAGGEFGEDVFVVVAAQGRRVRRVRGG